MARRIHSGKRGFTIIELMIVMAIITILVSVAVPFYQKSILRSKESVLKNNLFTLRTVIDEYTFDKQKAPQNLQDLVTEGYLRTVPVDPITQSDNSWKLIMEDAGGSVNQSEPGIFDVRSGSDKTSLEGTPYAEW
jgi:general secretion pathway protein G